MSDTESNAVADNHSSAGQQGERSPPPHTVKSQSLVTNGGAVALNQLAPLAPHSSILCNKVPVNNGCALELQDRRIGLNQLPPSNVNASALSLCKNKAKKDSSSSSAMFRKYLKRWPNRFRFLQNEGKISKPSWSMTSLMMLGLLLLLLILSVCGFLLIWVTDIYNNQILDNLVLAEGTQAAEWWEKPPIDTLLRVHIFNYTNTQRWMDRLDEKLHVEDIGPYVYRERFEKVHVVYNPNNTISYREQRTYEFMANLSNGKQYDTVIFPNVLLMSASGKVENSMFNWMIKQMLQGFDMFKTLSANELIWGYQDALYLAVKTYLPTMPAKFGMLTTRSGISADTITIHSGVDDIGKLGVIDQFAGSSTLSMWSTDECNRIDGTDGSQFPPQYMDKKHTLHVFSKAFCRRFPLEFSEEVNILDGIPAWRYRPPTNVFAHPDQNEQNQCFCDRADSCAPSGTFNVSKCFGDAPILLSFPHFFSGDSSLFANLDGLNPNEELHRTYADIHPRMGFPIGGSSRIQINLQVPTESTLIAGISRFEPKQILPIIWMEVSSGQITEELRATIYHSTFSTNAIELLLRYGSLFMCAACVLLIISILAQRKREYRNWQLASNSTAAPSTPNLCDEES